MIIIWFFSYDAKPINSPISWGLPNFICINDIISDSLAYGKVVSIDPPHKFQIVSIISKPLNKEETNWPNKKNYMGK
jgi:hypothetical protein